MTDRPRYWTPAFVETFVDRMNRDAAFQEAISDFSQTIVLRCLDTPDGKDLSAAYSFDEGYVSVDLEVEEAPSMTLRDAPFDGNQAMARSTATYEVWTQLDKGEMTVLGALTSPDYSIEGPKLKIMMNMGIFNAMNDLAASIEKSY